MNISYFQMSGWDGAVRSLFMSKKTYDEDLETMCMAAEVFSDEKLQMIDPSHRGDALEWYKEQILKCIKWGAKHYTLLRFVDITATVVGLHRGGQDDFDAHAERLDSRIVRMSTRTNYNQEITELSDFYKEKILSFDELSKVMQFPDAIAMYGKIFMKTPLGYVAEDYIDNADVRRGLIPLGTASTFTFKCNLADFCHIYRERCESGNANPEVKQLVELLADEIIRYMNDALGEDKNPITKEWLHDSCIQ